jgi:hypothetical protein
MALGTQVVHLVGLHLLDDAGEVAGVSQVAIVQLEARVFHVRVLVDVVDPAGVERAGAPLDAVHDVALLQQQFRQIRAVLAGDATGGDLLDAHGRQPTTAPFGVVEPVLVDRN